MASNRHILEHSSFIKTDFSGTGRLSPKKYYTLPTDNPFLVKKVVRSLRDHPMKSTETRVMGTVASSHSSIWFLINVWRVPENFFTT